MEGNTVGDGMIGADPVQLRELAKVMSGTREQLDSTVRELHAAVVKTGWKGPDSERFKARWNSTLRPTLRSTGAKLEDAAKLLVAQAAEQVEASAAKDFAAPPRVPQNPPTGNDGKKWSDVFTDPNYQHAPGGLEFVWEKFFGGDGAGGSTFTNAMKWVADKFMWNLSLADDLAKYMPTFNKILGVGGKALAGLGIVLGGLDIWSGIENKDPFRIADGTISAGLSAASLVLMGSVVGAPAGVIVGAVGLAWGIASLISGDVPLTKRIWDGGAAVVGGVKDAAGWLGSKLGFG